MKKLKTGTSVVTSWCFAGFLLTILMGFWRCLMVVLMDAPMLGIPLFLLHLALFPVAVIWSVVMLPRFTTLLTSKDADREKKLLASQGTFAASAGVIIAAAIVFCWVNFLPPVTSASVFCGPNRCINHLRMIDSGKEQWALASKKREGDNVDTNGVNSYIKGNTTPVCPSGGSYVYNVIGVNPQCSIEKWGDTQGRTKKHVAIYFWDYDPPRGSHRMPVSR